MSELEPLDADVLALLRAARSVPVVQPERKTAILEATAAKILLSAPTPGPASHEGPLAPTGGAAPSALPSAAAPVTSIGARGLLALAGTFALGVGSGVVIDRQVREPAPLAAMAPTTSASLPTPTEKPFEALTASPAPAPSPREGSPQAVPPRPSAPREPRPDVPAARVPLARGIAAERALLDVARSALARGEAAEALAAAERHTSEYPDGVLAEEREALAIKALVGLGRRDEARARARRFETRYPRSLSLHAVKGAAFDAESGP